MQEKARVLFSIWFFRIFLFAFGTSCLFFGVFILPTTPLAILFIPIGIFILRFFARIVLPESFRHDCIEYNSLFGKGRILFNEIRYARIWQASYTDMTIKNVIIVLPGFLNFYYLLSTKENNLVKELNMRGIQKRSMLFSSEVHLE
ncbi:hypothetical protein [Pseudodesulfovibrio mercurii]|uniref:hypothetical protein n=1 Tax=Pseudodesulfovibrio mercurii TaxID=641491 RepID=UPI0005A509C9|nr:hypothetical protein [Pseudodesulfovibrio mercurii]